MSDDVFEELTRLQSLDPAAVTQVHNRYYPEIYRYARYRLNDEAAADDITSEVFLRLLDAIQAGKGPNSSLRGWLMGTAANLISDHYRRSYSQPSSSLNEEIHASTGDPGEWLENAELRQLLQAALSQLTIEQQHILALRFGSGYSLEETAQITGKKANAVKALQFRALASLKKIMGDQK